MVTTRSVTGFALKLCKGCACVGGIGMGSAKDAQYRYVRVFVVTTQAGIGAGPAVSGFTRVIGRQ